MYVQATDRDRQIVRNIVDRLGVGRVVELLRLNELAVSDAEASQIIADGHVNNAIVLSNIEAKLVQAWVER